MHAVMLDVDTLAADPDLSPIESAVDTLTCHDSTAPSEVVSRLKGADIVITNKVVITRDIITALPDLKLICTVGTGTDHIDVAAAKEHGVNVRNVKGFGTSSIAQHTMMLMLSLAGHLLSYRHGLTHGEWSSEVSFTHRLKLMTLLEGRHLVIVGHGDIGTQVAHLAKAFGMRVTFSARPGQVNDPRPSLLSLLPSADVLSLHCPLTPETEELIDAVALATLPKGALLINCARGKVIDNKAALAALVEGHLGGLALDTLDQEPPAQEHPMLAALRDDRYNLILTPHSAWTSPEARTMLINEIAHNISTFEGH